MSEPEEDVVFWLKRIADELEGLNDNLKGMNEKLRDYFLSLDPDK
jgi:hypothetical protein